MPPDEPAQTDEAQPADESDDFPASNDSAAIRRPEPAARPRRLRPLVAAALACSIAVIGALILVERPSNSEAGLAVGAATAETTTPPPKASVTPRPALPIPDAIPADAHAPTEDVIVGHISIPKIGVEEDLHKGITLTSIDRGPGWWPHTAMPGELGNMVVAGHRVTHSKPFNRLDELVEGDQVIFTTDAGRFTYEVRGVIVVPAEWIDIAAQDYAHTATLFACHPKGRATHRIVAKLRLLNEDGTPADPDADLPAMNAEELQTQHTLVVRQSEDGVDGATGTDPLAEADG